MSDHRCPVGGCTRDVPYAKLMCAPDWRLVPKPLQSAVYAAWANGRGAGTPAHQAAIDAAIAAANAARADLDDTPRAPAGPPDDAVLCESCAGQDVEAWIVFATVSNNAGRKPSKMPVDAEPHPKGNVAAFRDVHKRLTGRVLAKDQQPTPYETRFMPHFATCVDPQAHRRRQRGNWTSAVNARSADQRRGRSRGQGRGAPIPPDVLPGMTGLYPGDKA
jgi:hypothetical protein